MASGKVTKHPKSDGTVTVKKGGVIVGNLPSSKDRGVPTPSLTPKSEVPQTQSKGDNSYGSASFLRLVVSRSMISEERFLGDSTPWSLDAINAFMKKQQESYETTIELENCTVLDKASGKRILAPRFTPPTAPDPAYRYEEMLETDDPAVKYALRKLGLEHYYSQPFPLFVYGTLRSGGPNFWRFINGSISRVEPGVRCQGIGLYSPAGGAPVPCASADLEGEEASSIVGDLVYLEPGDMGCWVRRRIDELEGFRPSEGDNPYYVRTEHLVPSADGTTVKAWVYLTKKATWMKGGNKVESGDWLDLHPEYAEQRQAHLNTANSLTRRDPRTMI